MEAVFAAVAVVVSTGGGLVTTAIHYGSTNQQIASIVQKQNDTDAHISKHDDQLSTIQQQNAGTAQSLSDIKDQLNRMEKKL
jgi:hypothetical protein